MLSRLYAWLDSRLKLEPVKETLLDEPIPGGASWIYVFGSATLFVFFLQAITGMFLAVYYAPTPDHAYDSIRYIETQVLFGPFVGTFLVRVMRGGDTLGALTLSRFFAVHILFLPAAIMALIALHMFILRRVGPAGPWSGGCERRGTQGDASLRQGRRAASAEERPPIERRVHRSEPFYPRQVFMDAVVMLGVFVVVAALALLVPFPLTDKANPSDHNFIPVPEWYFLFYYQFLKYMDGPILGPIATWVIPMLFIALLLALPFLDRHPERTPASRRAVIGIGVVFLAGVFVLIGLSLRDLRAMKRTDPAVAAGRALFERLQCASCHRIHGEGGAIGPDLSYGGDHRDRDWLIKHFRDPQSTSPGSIMPKFPLKERELNDLTAYMLSLKRRI